MTRHLLLGVFILIAAVAYPLGLQIQHEFMQIFEPSVPTAIEYSYTFAVAQVVALFALLGILNRVCAIGLSSAALAVIVWTIAGHSLWLLSLFLFELPFPSERLSLAFTSLTQAALGVLSVPLIREFVRSHAWWPVVGTLGCLPLFMIAYPEMVRLSAPMLGMVQFLTFAVLNFVLYHLVVCRRGLINLSPWRFAIAAAEWTLAAHLLWVPAAFLLRVQLPPRWLPLATLVFQGFLVVVLPIAMRLVTGRLRLGSLVYDPAFFRPETECDLSRGSQEGRKTAWVISYTGVSNEPRVLRQSRALIDDGWQVVVCGHDGHSPRPPEWTYIRLPASTPFRTKVHRILGLSRSFGLVLAAYGWPKFISHLGAHLYQTSIPTWLHNRSAILALIRSNPDLHADLVICNDYFTCDLGYAVAKHYRAKFVVDCHEYAAEQNSHDPTWVRWMRPYAVGVQDYYLKRADLITTVCDGIAALIDADHSPKRPTLVVRSVPVKCIQPFRKVGDRIKVLYHGNIWQVRHLHTAIESMRYWRPEFDLILRGEGDPSYIAELKRIARRHGVQDRVFFEPSVPFEQIVVAANKADIGYFSYANFSRQSEFVLPNKFFEYVMAGLALCVIDLPEMARLTRRYDLGKLIPENSSQSIAETINSFTRSEIEDYKQASLKAAEDLNWDHERRILVDAYNALFGEVATRGAVQPEHLPADWSPRDALLLQSNPEHTVPVSPQVLAADNLRPLDQKRQ